MQKVFIAEREAFLKKCQVFRRISSCGSAAPVFHPPLIIIVDALPQDLCDEDFVLAPVWYKQCQFMLNGGAASENGPPLLR